MRRPTQQGLPLSQRIESAMSSGLDSPSAGQQIVVLSTGLECAAPINFAQQTGLSAFVDPYPSITLDFSGIGSAVLSTLSSSTRERQWNLVDSASISLGHHDVKAGIDYRRVISTLNPFTASVSGLFYTPKSVLSDAATDAVVQKYLPSSPVFNETAVFLQDEWRISQKSHRISWSEVGGRSSTA